MLKTDNSKKRALKPIEQCPNGHYYNAITNGDICAVCGAKLDPPEPQELTKEEQAELTYIEEKNWVCGWLVCVQGPNKGHDYKIVDGKNFIGSVSSMDIQIVGDKRIEKKNHAVIMYDSLQKKVLLLPSDSRGMVYWQGQAIFEPIALEPFNVIELGESAFRYVPFCGPDFDWKEPMGGMSAGGDPAHSSPSTKPEKS